jgi:diaminopimelate decarboxylase
VDLGGGLGVPYAPDEAPLDLAALGRGLRDLLSEHAWFGGELLLEPGRFLAADCGVYLARVLRTKVSRGVRFAVLQGGLNHLARPQLTGQAFPVRHVSGGASGPAVLTTLAGPLCTSLDRLGEVDLPDDLSAGDLLAFGMAGAYGATEALTRFLSHPEAREVWVDDVSPR